MILIIICIIFFILTSILMSICVYLSKKITDPCINLLNKIVILVGSVSGEYIVKNNINIFNIDIDSLTDDITEYILNNITNVSEDNLVVESLNNNESIIQSFVKTYLVSLVNYINNTDYDSFSFDDICTEEESTDPKEQYDLYNSSHIWDMNNDEDYE